MISPGTKSLGPKQYAFKCAIQYAKNRFQIIARKYQVKLVFLLMVHQWCSSNIS